MKTSYAKMLKAHLTQEFPNLFPQFSPINNEYHSKYESLFKSQAAEKNFYFSFQNHRQYNAFVVECAISNEGTWPAYTMPDFDMTGPPKAISRFRIQNLFPSQQKRNLWWVLDEALFSTIDDPNLETVTKLPGIPQRIEFQVQNCLSQIDTFVLPFLRDKYNFDALPSS